MFFGLKSGFEKALIFPSLKAGVIDKLTILEKWILTNPGLSLGMLNAPEKKGLQSKIKVFNPTEGHLIS